MFEGVQKILEKRREDLSGDRKAAGRGLDEAMARGKCPCSRNPYIEALRSQDDSLLPITESGFKAERGGDWTADSTAASLPPQAYIKHPYPKYELDL